MLSNRTCLLFSSDSTTISDVRAALKLLNFTVRAVPSAFEAEAFVQEQKPALVLAQVKGSEGPAIGLEFGRSIIGSRPEGEKEPLVISLPRPEELPLLEKAKDAFDAMALLPVSFPNFTQEVEKVIQGVLSGSAPRKSTMLQRPEIPAQKNEENPFQLAFRIQSIIIQRLASDQSLMQRSPADIPDLVRELSVQVCNEVAQELGGKTQTTDAAS